MNLIEILEQRIHNLAVGEHTTGLSAVVQHIVIAARHLYRGQETGDESAYTDAIYRTNQAFEGSLKEAYRVLAGKDPTRIRPFDIEGYFQENSVLKTRVLNQFTRYRTEWRNPSTHDYSLEFDGDEALLAISGVCSFAIVLIDQMGARLAFETAQAVAQQTVGERDNRTLLERVEGTLRRVNGMMLTSREPRSPLRESELVGMIEGYLAALPGTTVQSEVRLGSGIPLAIADFVVEDAESRLVIEVKTGVMSSSRLEQVLNQVGTYMELGDFSKAVAYFHSGGSPSELERLVKDDPLTGRRVVVLH